MRGCASMARASRPLRRARRPRGARRPRSRRREARPRWRRWRGRSRAPTASSARVVAGAAARSGRAGWRACGPSGSRRSRSRRRALTCRGASATAASSAASAEGFTIVRFATGISSVVVGHVQHVDREALLRRAAQARGEQRLLLAQRRAHEQHRLAASARSATGMPSHGAPEGLARKSDWRTRWSTLSEPRPRASACGEVQLLEREVGGEQRAERLAAVLRRPRPSGPWRRCRAPRSSRPRPSSSARFTIGRERRSSELRPS